MIEVEGLVKTYGDSEKRAVNDISFSAPAGSVVTLLGASGCGKTTTLRSIAGLITPSKGMIRLGDTQVFNAETRLDLAANRRNIGMVFQSYAIWPHMTVGQNVAFPLEARKTDRKTTRKRVAEALELVGLSHLQERLAPNLSGGQQQRVALARAIVGEPDVLLLDEPLSNLDAKLRDEMRSELRSLHQRLGLTMCFVTHDQSEALGLADSVILMRDGRIVEAGPPEQLFKTPEHSYTATFLGASNLWPSAVEPGPDPGGVVLTNAFGRFAVTRGASSVSQHAHADMFFRRGQVELVDPGTAPEQGVARGKVVSRIFLGDTIQLVLESAGTRGTINVDPYLSHVPAIDDVAAFRPLNLIAFPREQRPED
jgi:iron(III) transport system ATP-binding protein